MWFDYVAKSVYRSRIDFGRSNAVYTTSATGNPYSQYYYDYLTTVQPYLEFARDLDAVVLSGAPLGQSSHNWSSVLPAIDAHYEIQPDLMVYAQVAKGFLAPPLSTLQSVTPGAVTPQTTTNYRIETVWQTDRLTLAGDGYYIPFNNYITSQTNANGTPCSNQGGAVYKGLEVEGTVRVLPGISIYANGTLKSAVFNNGQPIYQAPQRTAALGPVLDWSDVLKVNNSVYASVLWKEVGKQYGQNGNTATGPVVQFPIKSYGDLDIAANYTFPIQNFRKINIGFNLYNLFDNKSLIGLAGTTVGSPSLPLYWTNSGRSFFVTVSVTL